MGDTPKEIGQIEPCPECGGKFLHQHGCTYIEGQASGERVLGEWAPEVVVIAAAGLALGSGDVHARAGTAQLSGCWSVYRGMAIDTLDALWEAGYELVLRG